MKIGPRPWMYGSSGEPTTDLLNHLRELHDERIAECIANDRAGRGDGLRENGYHRIAEVLALSTGQDMDEERT